MQDIIYHKTLSLGIALCTFLALGQNTFAYEAVEVAGGASISGTVLFQGTAPKPKQILIGKDTEVCGTGHFKRYDIAVNDDGALRDVVVFLEKVEKGKVWPATEDYKLVQKHCVFEPYLQVMPKKAELTIVNNDSVLHNLHPREIIGERGRRTLFNLGQPKMGATTTKAINPRRGDVIQLTCDAHNWMLGWIYTIDHPYFAVVDVNGHFQIDDIPPGTYTVKAWHPFLGVQESELNLALNAETELQFSFAAN